MHHAEDIETSLSDYQKALTILERMVEPDSRHIAELYPCQQQNMYLGETVQFCFFFTLLLDELSSLGSSQ